MRTVLRTLPLLVALAGLASGQFQNRVTTVYAGPSVFDGNMFDVTTTADVTACGVDVNLEQGQYDLEVWVVTAGTTWVGNDQNVSAWTLVSSAIGVTSRGPDVPTPFPTPFAVQIPSGAQTGFYVTVSSGSTPGQGMRYSNGALVGNPAGGDGTVTILEGAAKGYPFTNTYPPRIWNGTLYYEEGLVSACTLSRPTAPEYETNDVRSSMTLDGLADPGPFSPISRVVAVNFPVTVDLASDAAGFPWEVAINVGGLTSGFSTLGLATPMDQTINVDLGAPSLLWLNGISAPNLSTSTFPANPFSLSLVPSAPLAFSGQMVVVSPTHPEGIALSHACEVTAVPCTVGSDFESVALGTGSAPSGWQNPAGGGFPWTVISGPTPTALTGPSGAFSGSRYIYCETSGGAGSATFLMDTCLVPASSAPLGQLSFRLSRIGAAIGTLNVWMDDGTGVFASLVGSFTGEEPNMTEWTAETLPFAPASSHVSFRFDYTGGGTYLGDLGIDDIMLR